MQFNLGARHRPIVPRPGATTCTTVGADTEFARHGPASLQGQAQLLKGWLEPNPLVPDDQFLARHIVVVSVEILQAITCQRNRQHRVIAITCDRELLDGPIAWPKHNGHPHSETAHASHHIDGERG